MLSSVVHRALMGMTRDKGQTSPSLLQLIVQGIWNMLAFFFGKHVSLPLVLPVSIGLPKVSDVLGAFTRYMIEPYTCGLTAWPL